MDQIFSLISWLKYNVADVAELSAKFDGTFNLVAYLNSNYPGFFVEASLVRDLANMSVGLDCEYIYAPDEPIEEAEDAD